MIIEILPPLTELTPLPANMPAYERPMVQEPQGGLPLLTLLTRRPRARAFHQQPIPRDAVLAISRLSLRGGTYYPLRPDGRHAGLVRPFWIIHQVTGMDPGIWYYDPVTDRWTQLSRGRFRLDAAYLSADHPAAMNAAAICFLMVNLNHLLVHAGPDVYRLAHLEAGIVAHRMDLTAAALDLGAVLNARFFDDDARRFFGLEHTGWEFLYEVMFGVPDDQFHPPPPTIAVPEEEQSQQ
jgi:SagB-type dehydrogenase family enzyme